MWRWYKESDKEAVTELHRSMERRLGRPMDLPDLFVEPVVAAAVYETDGIIQHCIFIEAQIEACILSEKPLTAKRAQQAIDNFLMPTAKRYKLRLVRAFVPTSILAGKNGRREGPVPRLLRKLGFTRENETMASFYQWLVPQDEELEKT